MFGPQRSLEAKPPTSTSTGRSIAEKTGPSRGLLLLLLFLFLILTQVTICHSSLRYIYNITPVQWLKQSYQVFHERPCD